MLASHVRIHKTSVVAALLLPLVAALAVMAGTAHGTTELERAACVILNSSDFPGIPNAADLTPSGLGSCQAGECRQTVTDPDTGSVKCHYGRSAYLSIGCHGTAKRARAFVSNLIHHRGYRSVRLNVDAAADHASSKTAQVAMALGSQTIGLVMDAFSDDDPHPTWSHAKQDALRGARNLIHTWRHNLHGICGR